MLLRSTIQLLRFHFSFFLLPVYLFALSQVFRPNWYQAALIFVILHLLVYPASNGYNSYMDRDEESIGGLEKPMQPTRQLFFVTVAMDITAVLLSFLISIYFVVGIIAYILASRAYSYRGIRLKKHPLIGYLTVVLFQGAVTYWLVFHGSHPKHRLDVGITGIISATLLIGGFYPLTQIYQHEADRKDGVQTISAMLGYKGTFIFTGIVYLFAFFALAYHFMIQLEPDRFLVLQLCMLPVLIYFFVWAVKVWKEDSAANFKNTMRMNLLASVCSNLAYLILLIWGNI